MGKVVDNYQITSHDGGLAVKKEPQVGWWIADIANLISISFAVIAQVCLSFAESHWIRTDLTAAGNAFIVRIGQCCSLLASAWIVVGFVFAMRYRTRTGTANEAIAYVVLLMLALAGVVSVLVTMPST